MTILVPVDFSDATKPVIAQASRLSKALGLELLLIHIYSPVVDKMDYTTAPDFGPNAIGVMNYIPLPEDEATKNDKEKKYLERLNKLEKQIAKNGVKVKSELVEGIPSSQIIKQSKKHDADTIVLGSHGHGAVYELLVGSTTDYVLRHSKRPVLVVPAH